MRNFFKTKLLTLGTLFLGTGLAIAGETYDLSANDLFVPEGFDDNDNVQVILDGWINNGCDQVLPPKVDINFEDNTIHVQPQAQTEAQNHDGELKCLPVLTRFSSVADLGMLPYGNYEVKTNNGWLVHNIQVLEATNSGPDELLFAKIDKARIDYALDGAAPGKMEVVLIGDFLNTCQTWDEIEIQTQPNNTFVVSPKIKIEGEICAQVMTPFTVRVPIDEPLVEARYLTHVRTIDGKAINVVFTGSPEL